MKKKSKIDFKKSKLIICFATEEVSLFEKLFYLGGGSTLYEKDVALTEFESLL